MASSFSNNHLHRLMRYFIQHSISRFSLISICCLVIVACSLNRSVPPANPGNHQSDRPSAATLESVSAPLPAPPTPDLSGELQPSASEIARVALSQSAARSLPSALPSQLPTATHSKATSSPESATAQADSTQADTTQADTTQADTTQADTVPMGTLAQADSQQAGSGAQRVEFAPNQSSAVLEGSVIRGDRAIYILHARSGQQLDLLLTSIEDNAVFDVIAPDSTMLITESTNTQIPLPTTGDYQILISGTRGNATYRLDIAVK